MMRFVFLAIVMLVLPVAGKPESGRGCRILFLGAPEGSPETVQLFDGKTSREVELSQMSFSPVYELPAGEMDLKLMTEAPASPEAVNPGAPRVRVVEGVGDFYLLISSDPENKVLPMKMQVVDADPERFRKGQMLWFNLTPNRVGGTLGSESLVLEPNSRKIVDAPAKGSEAYLVNLSFRIPGKEALYPLCETKWLHDPRARSVVFVVAQAGSRTPRILGFPDFREEAKKDGEGN